MIKSLLIIFNKMVKKKEIVCKLTERQNYLWEKYYSMCINNGMSEKEADEETFNNLKDEFPSLKRCDKLE